MHNVKSPCIRCCCLDQADTCMGCFRTLEEIKEWSQASLKRKQEILDNALLRENSNKEGEAKAP